MILLEGIGQLWYGGVFTEDRLEVAQALLDQSSAEQVGFLEDEAAVPRLTMMGGELCINGLLAAATAMGERDGVIIGPNELRVTFSKNEGLTSICLPLAYQKKSIDDQTVVLFDSIGYVVSSRAPILIGLKEELKDKCGVWNMPAFGYVQSYGNQIRPYVYVRDTDSLVAETACGSGSVAAYVTTDAGYAGSLVNMYQPTRQPIRIQRTNQQNSFTISARVDRIA